MATNRAKLEHDLIALRLAVLRQLSWCRINAMSKQVVKHEIRQALKELGEDGVIETMTIAGRVRAAFLLTRERPFYSKKPRPICKILARGGDREANRWVRAMLKKHRGRLRSQIVHLHLDAPNRELLPALEAAGFGIWFVKLTGDPGVALRALERRYGDLAWEKHTHLRIEPLRTPAQVEAVIRLIRREFRRKPQFGPFVASPAFLAQVRKWFDKARKKRNPHNYLIYDGRKLVGQFDFDFSDKSQYGGRTGGFALNFSQSIQKQGLAKLAYAVMLRRMIEQDVRFLIGGTAQKPVMHLAKVMKRPLAAYLLTTGETHFGREHFRY